MQIARLFLLSRQKVISMPAPSRRSFIVKTAGLGCKVCGGGLLALMSAGHLLWRKVHLRLTVQGG